MKGANEEKEKNMRSIASFFVGFCLVMMHAPALAQTAKCHAEKNAMDQAWKNYDKADNDWQASLKPLESALASKEAADKAYEAAKKASDIASDQLKQADKRWISCIESETTQDCLALSRAMSAAKSQFDKAVADLEEAIALVMAADNDWKNAKAKTHDLLMKLKAAREAFENASTNFSRCLRGKPKFA